MAETPSFACTLGPDDAARRESNDHALGAALADHRWEHERRAVLVFPAASAPQVERFVRDESACCTFFEFAVEHVGDEVRLDVTAPEGAEPMLRQLVAAFAG